MQARAKERQLQPSLIRVIHMRMTKKPFVGPLAIALAFLSYVPTSAWSQPAPDAYHATPDDIAAIQEGITGALTVAPGLFPGGIEKTDVILYDSTDLYIWTRGTYPLPKIGTWNGYNIFRTTHGAAVTERQMARCGGEARFVLEPLTVARREHFFFTCAPAGSFTKIQNERRSIYDSRDSYLATMIHEYAHHYMDQELWQIPTVSSLAVIVNKMATSTDKTTILQEAYAIWCELTGARKLYPAHAARLIGYVDPRSQDPHMLGLAAVLELDRAQ